jgi:hypothetical protein
MHRRGAAPSALQQSSTALPIVEQCCVPLARTAMSSLGCLGISGDEHRALIGSYTALAIGTRSWKLSKGLSATTQPLGGRPK